MQHIIGIDTFLNQITKNSLTPKQLNRIKAILRANRLIFLDDWSNDFVILLSNLEKNETKITIMQAIQKVIM